MNSKSLGCGWYKNLGLYTGSVDVGQVYSILQLLCDTVVDAAKALSRARSTIAAPCTTFHYTNLAILKLFQHKGRMAGKTLLTQLASVQPRSPAPVAAWVGS